MNWFSSHRALLKFIAYTNLSQCNNLVCVRLFNSNFLTNLFLMKNYFNRIHCNNSPFTLNNQYIAVFISFWVYNIICWFQIFIILHKILHALTYLEHYAIISIFPNDFIVYCSTQIFHSGNLCFWCNCLSVFSAFWLLIAPRDWRTNSCRFLSH